MLGELQSILLSMPDLSPRLTSAFIANGAEEMSGASLPMSNRWTERELAEMINEGGMVGSWDLPTCQPANLTLVGRFEGLKVGRLEETRLPTCEPANLPT